MVASFLVLTSRVGGKHAHQWGELRRATAVGNVQSSTSWSVDASSNRLLVALRALLALRLLLLLLLHLEGNLAAAQE